MNAPLAITGVSTSTLGLLAGIPGADVALDALERGVLFLDTLRQRGNIYTEHVNDGAPALLKFEHELVLDGRDLPRRCNYSLLHLLPVDGVATNPQAVPVVVVDPRAGHGPGIGGFKKDSEIGVALRAGHPVYFVTFRPQPEEGQTLADVMAAEARFLDVVAERHPEALSKPIVIGNCQAGWAIAMLAAARPELFGTTVLVGSPMSYWAGASTMNPMRYSGASLGGAWLASFTGDLNADRFDGAHLVENFEKLNPAHAKWSKYQRLYAKVDTEADRFLDFERWWGGYFRMTGAEIETIVENLFVGNRLARGDMQIDGLPLDLRNITSPVLCFASWGDNITPPPQALDWIIDTWGDERAIAAAGRTIIYVLHEDIGHLGIFVGGDIARKEHDQIVNSMDVIASLPPGLYEMKLVDKAGHNVERAPERWDELEPGSYSADFIHRTMDDIRALNPEGREEEQLFSTVAQLSEINSAIYKTWARPFVRALANRKMTDAVTHLHPMRLQRQLVSDIQPGSAHLAAMAGRVREQRHALPDDHPARQVEKQFSDLVEISLDLYRDLRDQATVNWTRMAFGPFGLGAWLRPLPSDAERAEQRASADLARHRREVLPHLGTGNLARAVCRIVQAGMLETGSFERRSLRLARQLADRYPNDAQDEAIDWQALMHDEARVLAVAPTQALQALAAMLPDVDLRERALAVAAAVLMVEPTPEAPQYDVVERLIIYLGVSPERVFELAQALVQPFEQGADISVRAASPGVPRDATPAPVATAKRTKRGARAGTPIVRTRRKGLAAVEA
jgi:pimeloyl-ACP methyl ester carboxylesterase